MGGSKAVLSSYQEGVKGGIEGSAVKQYMNDLTIQGELKGGSKAVQTSTT